ncbi:MAG: hypothetical protein ACTIJ6_02640 [Leucobacter sp.]
MSEALGKLRAEVLVDNATAGSRESDVRLARLLFPELAHDLDQALGDEDSIDARIDRKLEAAAGAARSGALGQAAFEGVNRTEAERLESAFTSAREIAQLAGLALPEPEAFWAAGVNRQTMSRALLGDPSLVAVPAPYGLGVERWIALYRTAARRPESALSLASPLSIASEVKHAFAEIDVAPPETKTVSSTPPGGASSVASLPVTIHWSLRLISATEVPPRTGMNHSIGPHATLPEMLMLQLMLLIQGKDPVDRQSFTWTEGTFADGKFAARHFYDSAGRGVGVNSREVGNQGPHLGARPPLG